MAHFLRTSLPLAAAVRQHFGLTQVELAAFIGVSQANLAHVEAGRKQLGPGPDQRLQVLARQLPPPDGHGPPLPAFGDEAAPAAAPLGATPAVAGPAAPAAAPATGPTPTPDPAARAALRRRLARCQWQRAQLLHELGARRQPGQARHLRRQWAVQVLGPALAAPLPVPDWLAPGGPALPLPPYPLATPDAARDTHWLQGLALRLAAATPPLPPGAAALTQARLAGLAAEIQVLRAALGAEVEAA